jgi:hypothetical protein
MEAYIAVAAQAGRSMIVFSCKSDAKRHAIWRTVLTLMWDDPNLILCTRDSCIWMAVSMGLGDLGRTDMLLQDTNLPAVAKRRFAKMEQYENNVVTCFHRSNIRCTLLTDPLDYFKRWLGCDALNGKPTPCVVCLRELADPMHLCTQCAKGMCKEDYHRLQVYARAEGTAVKCPHCRLVWANA